MKHEISVEWRGIAFDNGLRVSPRYDGLCVVKMDGWSYRQNVRISHAACADGEFAVFDRDGGVDLKDCGVVRPHEPRWGGTWHAPLQRGGVYGVSFAVSDTSTAHFAFRVVGGAVVGWMRRRNAVRNMLGLGNVDADRERTLTRIERECRLPQLPPDAYDERVRRARMTRLIPYEMLGALRRDTDPSTYTGSGDTPQTLAVFAAAMVAQWAERQTRHGITRGDVDALEATGRLLADEVYAAVEPTGEIERRRTTWPSGIAFLGLNGLRGRPYGMLAMQLYFALAGQCTNRDGAVVMAYRARMAELLGASTAVLVVDDSDSDTSIADSVATMDGVPLVPGDMVMIGDPAPATDDD